MWIMLLKKLPTEVSPPKLSFHWADPWRDDTVAPMQRLVKIIAGAVKSTAKELRAAHKKLDPPGYAMSEKPRESHLKYSAECSLFYEPLFAMAEPDWDGAMRIYYKGEQIRVFPHEFQSEHSMKLYLEDSVLIKHEHEEVRSAIAALTPAKKLVYEQALLDGCNKYQAELVSLGRDPWEAELPPTAWYEVRREYAEVYCTEREMEG